MDVDSVSTQCINAENLGKVRNLCKVIYPVQYTKAFFDELLDSPLSRVYIQNGDIVATVCCQIQQAGSNYKRLYIQIFGVSPLYRELGFGVKMFDFVIKCANENAVDALVLHVQTSNERAIEFYKRRGFQIDKTELNYYSRCNPTSAHFMLKKL